jgi:hypothetical protein
MLTKLEYFLCYTQRIVHTYTGCRGHKMSGRHSCVNETRTGSSSLSEFLYSFFRILLDDAEIQMMCFCGSVTAVLFFGCVSCYCDDDIYDTHSLVRSSMNLSS